jgi:peroxiredoxin
MAEDVDRKGPGIGERFPDITLPDQTGAPIRLQQARRGRQALVVFYRSARW